MKKLSIIITLIILTGMFYSCEEQIEVQPEINIESADTDFTVKDGYLSFSSTESFIKTINTISSFSKEERINWENQIGFLSQRTIVDIIIDEEIAIYETIKEKFKGKKINEINKRDLHSDIYNQYLDKGVIKLIDEGTKDEYWNHSACNPAYLGFINEDGFYAIGDTLYQITENNSKGSAGLIWSNWEGTSSHRAIMGIYLQGLQHLNTLGSHWNYRHNVYCYTQCRTWYGGWMYEVQYKKLTGSWHIRMFRNPVYLRNDGMLESWSSPQFAVAVYPETGYTYIQDYIFSTWSREPSYYDYLYGPEFINYHWTTVVHVRTSTENFYINLVLTTW